MADAALFAQAKAQLGPARELLRNTKTPTQKLDAATALLRILGTLAANAPTDALRQEWLAQYRALQPQAATLRAQVTDQAPGAVLRALDTFSDRVLGFAGTVLTGAGDVVGGLAATAKAAPVLLFVLIVAAAVVLVKVGPQLVGATKRRRK